MWKYENDSTPPVITARAHIQSSHKTEIDLLLETAILFYMHGGVAYFKENFDTELLSSKLPCFLNSRPVYKIKNKNICFLRGGWGAPMAADTVETLSALGVKNLISISVGAYLGVSTLSILIASDKHPVNDGEKSWEWTMTNKARYSFFDECIKFSFEI